MAPHASLDTQIAKKRELKNEVQHWSLKATAPGCARQTGVAR
jgi:hypothetical protein